MLGAINRPKEASMMRGTERPSISAPYEPTYAELLRSRREREREALSPGMRQLAELVDLLTELYHFKEGQR